MPIDQLTQKPTTNDYLSRLFQSVFTPLRMGQSVSIITFAGAGKWANVRFIIDHMNEIDPAYPKTAYLYLNAKDLAFSPMEEVKNGITFMLAKAIIQKNSLVQGFAENNVKYDDPLSFSRSFLRLVNEYNQRLVIIVDEAETLFIPDRKASNAVTFLQTMVNIEVSKITFLFLTKAEVTEAPENLRYLHKFYSQQTVTESEIPFDKNCAYESLSNFEIIHNITLTEHAKDNIATYTEGDPIILKFLFMEYAAKPEVKSLLDEEKPPRIELLYETANTRYIDERYYQLILSLSPKSRDYLYKLTGNPTPFLKDTNIVNAQGEVISKLFKHYIDARSSRYDLNTLEDVPFTPREERVFRLLLDSLGKNVTREEVAESLWGDTWKSQYSEESIDKVVSSIRNKMSNVGDGVIYQLKSAKGMGVVLERVR